MATNSNKAFSVVVVLPAVCCYLFLTSFWPANATGGHHQHNEGTTSGSTSARTPRAHPEANAEVLVAGVYESDEAAMAGLKALLPLDEHGHGQQQQQLCNPVDMDSIVEKARTMDKKQTDESSPEDAKALEALKLEFAKITSFEELVDKCTAISKLQKKKGKTATKEGQKKPGSSSKPFASSNGMQSQIAAEIVEEEKESEEEEEEKEEESNLLPNKRQKILHHSKLTGKQPTTRGMRRKHNGKTGSALSSGHNGHIVAEEEELQENPEQQGRLNTGINLPIGIAPHPAAGMKRRHSDFSVDEQVANININNEQEDGRLLVKIFSLENGRRALLISLLPITLPASAVVGAAVGGVTSVWMSAATGACLAGAAHLVGLQRHVTLPRAIGLSCLCLMPTMLVGGGALCSTFTLFYSVYGPKRVREVFGRKFGKVKRIAKKMLIGD